MSSPELLNESEELSDVIVTLNITETNITMNGTKARTFMKSNFFNLLIIQKKKSNFCFF